MKCRARMCHITNPSQSGPIAQGTRLVIYIDHWPCCWSLGDWTWKCPSWSKQSNRCTQPPNRLRKAISSPTPFHSLHFYFDTTRRHSTTISSASNLGQFVRNPEWMELRRTARHGIIYSNVYPAYKSINGKYELANKGVEKVFLDAQIH
jgi:hypothetical protein